MNIIILNISKKKKEKYDYKLEPAYIERQKALDEVKDFNATLNSNKKAKQKIKSFWEKLSDCFR